MEGFMMKRFKQVVPWIFGAALALPVSIVAAQGSLPDERILGDVSFVSGGASADQAAALRHAESQYSLALEMWPKDAAAGEYVADAQVEIRDGQGNTVFNTVADGPILLARVPPGTYTVIARWKGTLKQQAVDLTRPRTEQVLLEFPR
jgi:hypothetical protein